MPQILPDPKGFSKLVGTAHRSGDYSAQGPTDRGEVGESLGDLSFYKRSFRWCPVSGGAAERERRGASRIYGDAFIGDRDS